ncbi:T9SS type A sorting domain-containing protein [Zobellia sp.]|nr:T9SS type A sorting domain-containing protein [Zobellia sp.]
MKHFYLILTFLCISFSYGQETQGNGGIKGLKLYPNPVTNGKVYVSTSENTTKNILIYDVLGNQVFQTKIKGDELNLSDLDAGVYVLRVYQNKKVATRKLIIK